MRKFLVKHFVLDYSFIMFNRRWSAPRASRIIFPLMTITGYLVSINPNYPKPDLLLLVMYFLSLVSLFFGFVYFRIKPAKFEELDEKQKLQYKAFISFYK
jgi:hypothetical protein